MERRKSNETIVIYFPSIRCGTT